MKVLKTEIEKQRAFWAKLAKANGWFTEPFHVQIWVDENGDISDSVSYIGLAEDIIIEE
jgi:hypothetical protein